MNILAPFYRAIFVLIGLFSLSATTFAQGELQSIVISQQTGEITFAGRQPADFRNGIPTVVALIALNESTDWSIRFVGQHTNITLNTGNVPLLGTVRPTGISMQVNSDGKFAQNASLQITYPCSLIVTVQGRERTAILGAPSSTSLPTNTTTTTTPKPTTTNQPGAQQDPCPDTPCPFYDALNAAEALRSGNSLATEILSKYSLNGSKTLTKLKAEFYAINPILFHATRDYNDTEFIKNPPPIELVAPLVESQNAGPGSGLTGILSPAAAADAIGTFIAERFKQELNIAFLDRFRKDLERDTLLSTLFPNTVALLTEADPYHYTTFLQSLREAFEADLERLDQSTLSILELPQVRAAAEKYIPAEGYDFMLELVMVYEMAQAGEHPLEILQDLDPGLLGNQNLENSLRIVQQIGELWKDIGSGKNAAKNLRKIKVDPLAQKLYLGMVLAQDAGETSMKSASVDLQVFAQRADSVMDEVYATLDNVIAHIIEIQRQLDALNKLKEQGLPMDYNLFQRYVTQFLDLVEEAGTFAKTLYPDVDIDRITYSVTVANDLLAVGNAVHGKKYGLAITGLVRTLGQVLGDSDTKTLVMKYGNLMVTLVNAQSAEEMVGALEAAALPVGSYRIKRNSFVNISLNAYAGVFGAYEVLQNDSIPTNLSKAGNIGFTAPVGIAFSLGTFRKGSKVPQKFEGNPHFRGADGTSKYLTGRSWTLFLSVIDVGAVTAFRLRQDSTPLPNLTWRNLMAPGAHIVYGFGKCPISIGIGGQFGPQLRSIKLDSTLARATIQSSAIRLDGFVAVDIPFFNFYSRNTPSIRYEERNASSAPPTTAADQVGSGAVYFKEAKSTLEKLNRKLPSENQVRVTAAANMVSLRKAANQMLEQINALQTFENKAKWAKLKTEVQNLIAKLPAS